MLPSFRRKPSDDVPEQPAEEADAPVSVAGARSRSYTPGKGKATPKRRDAGRRPLEKPPANRREALRRMREKQRVERTERRAGMMAGKEEYLLRRDQGPERALIRDLVDARRNLASYFIIGLFIVIIGSSQAMPPAVRFGTNIFWIVLAMAVIVDSVILAQKIKKTLRQRFPNSTLRMGANYVYGVMRAFSFRRLRMPAPRVKVGEKI